MERYAHLFLRDVVVFAPIGEPTLTFRTPRASFLGVAVFFD